MSARHIAVIATPNALRRYSSDEIRDIL